MFPALSFLLFCLFSFIDASILSYTSLTSEQIFNNHQIVLILVNQSEDYWHTQDKLQEVCSSNYRCYTLEPDSAHYEQVTNFVGYPFQSYLAIIDAKNRCKYVLQVDSGLGCKQQIVDFIHQFQTNELKPFYASESVPEQNSLTKCPKLVGSIYEQFLGKEEPIKIVYLYSSDKICHNCQSFLQKFTLIAQKHVQQGLLVMGYLDVSKNDNYFIKDEIFPFFLIYLYDNFEDPFGVDAEQFQELEMYIQQLKSDVTKRSAEEESRSQNDDQLEEL